MLTRNELFALLAIAKHHADKGTQPHGLAIERVLAKAGHVINQGALYDTLRRLKRDGHVETRTGRRTQSGGKAPIYYNVTQDGHSALSRFFVTFDLLRFGELRAWRGGPLMATSFIVETNPGRGSQTSKGT